MFEKKRLIQRTSAHFLPLVYQTSEKMATSLASRLLDIGAQLVRYELPFIFVFGITTNLINVMIFSRRILRKNVCSWYFISLSLLHFLLLIIICTQSIIATWTGYNMAAYVLGFCKIRQYLFDLITSLSRHFLYLISIDRWMVTSSNAWLRQKSSPRIARWLIVTGIIFWAVFNLHSPIQFRIVSNSCTASSTSTYFFFYSIYTIIISILPMIIMSVFSVLTLQNLRARRVIPTFSTNTVPTVLSVAVINPNEHRRSQRDIHLIRLSTVQVVAFLLFNSGWCVYPLYLFITSSRGNRTLEERLLSAFLVNLGFNLLYTYAAVCFLLKGNSNALFLFLQLTFVLYTLASAQFRKECRMTLKEIPRVVLRRLGMLC